MNSFSSPAEGRCSVRLTEKLESDDDIPVAALVPVYGVSVDKMLALRGDSALTIRHEHTHFGQVDLVARFNAAIECIERRIKGTSVEVPVLPPRDASVAGKNVAQTAG
jgi:hypothetical protein